MLAQASLDGIIVNIGEFVGNVATMPANEIEIARLPKRPMATAALLDGVAGLEFPLMH